QHRGGAVRDLRRRAGGVHAVLTPDRLQGGELLEGRLAQALVAGDDVGLTRRLAVVVENGRRDGHHLALVAALTPGALRPLLRLEPEAIAVVARDAPLLGDALGSLELRCRLVAREVRLREGATRARLHVGPERNAAHRLDATRQHDVGRARADERGGQVRGLLRRPALAVDGGAGDRERQAGGE